MLSTHLDTGDRINKQEVLSSQENYNLNLEEQSKTHTPRRVIQMEGDQYRKRHKCRLQGFEEKEMGIL